MNLKPMVNNPEIYQNFLEYVGEELKKIQITLETASSLEEIKFLQGQASFCRRLLKLREKVNNG